jgi:signal transduction histidine kinase
MGNVHDDISIKTAIEPHITAAISENRLKQLVINLLNNAVQACGKMGGEVLLELKRVGMDIELSVTDSGPGIPESLKSEIFKPYFTTRDKGTGLGLSIVHQIVEEFGGQIDLRTPKPGGAEFVARFPSQ